MFNNYWTWIYIMNDSWLVSAGRNYREVQVIHQIRKDVLTLFIYYVGAETNKLRKNKDKDL